MMNYKLEGKWRGCSCKAASSSASVETTLYDLSWWQKVCQALSLFASQHELKADLPLPPHSAVLGSTGRGHRAGEYCSCQHHWMLATRENWNTLLCLFCLCAFSSPLLIFSSNNSYLWILFFKILLAKVWLLLNSSIMLIACAVVQSLLSHRMLEWATGYSH